jgi:hypothetical protein
MSTRRLFITNNIITCLPFLHSQVEAKATLFSSLLLAFLLLIAQPGNGLCRPLHNDLLNLHASTIRASPIVPSSPTNDRKVNDNAISAEPCLTVLLEEAQYEGSERIISIENVSIPTFP